ncbi:competence type IV pilus minor pilin ComGE [Bacillaceae bacterium IKA-2]|nr:competence type IV pilus minor pilin ComGE [Bacillaceae bacterium IKA-2]
MKNCKGFTLVEVMTSLLIVTVMISVLVPTLAIVYKERVSIRQEERALFHLERAITSWIYQDELNDGLVVGHENTQYTLAFMTIGNHELKACISWISENERQYERCASGKR